MNREKLLKRLKDRSFRRAFAEEAVDVGVPIQIRELRTIRRWTQKRLGEEAGVPQESVSRAESLSYGRFTLATLKNLAAAFDCALIVRFAPFSELLEWKEQLNAATVTPPDYLSDAALHETVAAPPAELIETTTATDDVLTTNALPLHAHYTTQNRNPRIEAWLKQKMNRPQISSNFPSQTSTQTASTYLVQLSTSHSLLPSESITTARQSRLAS